MIPELVWFALLFLVVICVTLWLSESETLRDYGERQNVNKLADNSRRRKPQGMRPRSKYIRAGIQK